MFHVALLSQRRIAREHNGANQNVSDNGVVNGDDDDGVHVLGIDDRGEYFALIQSVYVCVATKLNLIDHDAETRNGSNVAALLVRYRHQRYVNIAVDIRSGQLTASEVGSGSDEVDGKSQLNFGLIVYRSVY
jgi:hypothetical protein